MESVEFINPKPQFQYLLYLSCLPISIKSAVLSSIQEKKILLALSILIVQTFVPPSFSKFKPGCCGFLAKVNIALIVLFRSCELFFKNFFRSERYFGEYCIFIIP